MSELTIDVDLLTLPKFQSHVLSGTLSSDLNSGRYSSIGNLTSCESEDVTDS